MEEHRHIRLLPAAVANKIAAGEVVERPASVVKEFMENSFDAGATRVEVDIVAGGRKLISVADDGCGMDRDDALLCLEPQATSKIRNVDDIERIDTYGFRGEAIPSVASVSRMVIKTCARDENVGTCVEVDGGKVRSVGEIGFPQGTTMEVRDLFFNVPARRKFLKSYNTEQAHIRTVFTLQALAHPEARMSLRADGRDVISLAGGATLEERVHDLFGPEMLDALRLVDFSNGSVKVHGFVALPTLTRSDRSEQYIFVNRRAATAAVIPFALREAYPPLDGDRKPVVILFIEVPPTDVDVNVHPTKREVRFRDARTVRDTIILAVQKALGLGSWRDASARDDTLRVPIGEARGEMARAHDDTSRTSTEEERIDNARGEAAAYGGNGAVAAAVGAGKYRPPRPVAPVGAAITGAVPVQTELEITSPSGGGNSLWEWCRLLGQIAGGYLLMETDGGYVVVDPKAAHERVLYERMLEAAEGRQMHSQPLLIPQSATLPPEDARRIADNLDAIRSLGISADLLGDNTFIVEALPSGMEIPDVRTLLTDISQGIAEAGGKRGAADWRLKALARTAALSAVSRTGSIPWKGLAALVEELARAKMPYTTPRGNPTMLFTSVRELDRKFGRGRDGERAGG